LVAQILGLKTQIVQTLKQVRNQHNTNQQTQEDIDKLNQLVTAKKSHKQGKEVMIARREVKAMEKERGELKILREAIVEEIDREGEEREGLEKMIGLLKKQINEAKREKERLAIEVKQTGKIVEALRKRKLTLDGDSQKMLAEFQDTMY
jgi:chromosome segregation ATPase